jgi:hypothetical protein
MLYIIWCGEVQPVPERGLQVIKPGPDRSARSLNICTASDDKAANSLSNSDRRNLFFFHCLRDRSHPPRPPRLPAQGLLRCN